MKFSPGSFQPLWFPFPSLSQVQVCPLSAVPRHPLVPPATLTATLSQDPLTAAVHQEQSDVAPPGGAGAEEPPPVCGKAGFPNDFFRKSTV